MALIANRALTPSERTTSRQAATHRSTGARGTVEARSAIASHRAVDGGVAARQQAGRNLRLGQKRGSSLAARRRASRHSRRGRSGKTRRRSLRPDRRSARRRSSAGARTFGAGHRRRAGRTRTGGARHAGGARRASIEGRAIETARLFATEATRAGRCSELTGDLRRAVVHAAPVLGSVRPGHHFVRRASELTRTGVSTGVLIESVEVIGIDVHLMVVPIAVTPRSPTPEEADRES